RIEKKESTLSSVNHRLLALLNPDEMTVVIRVAVEAEVDEMWSFVGKKREPRWLWHAIDHRSGKVLAYVVGRRPDEVFLKLKVLLEPFGIKRYYTDYGSVPVTGTKIIQHHKCLGGTRKLSNSSIVHTWSVNPAAMAGVTGFHFFREPFRPLVGRLWGR